MLLKGVAGIFLDLGNYLSVMVSLNKGHPQLSSFFIPQSISTSQYYNFCLQGTIFNHLQLIIRIIPMH